MTNGSAVTYFDNDLAYELQRSGINIRSTSWEDIPVSAEKDKNKQEKEVHSKSSNVAKQKFVSWNDMPRSENDRAKIENDGPKIDNDIADNRFACEIPGLSLNSLDDKLIQKQLNREASRNKEKDLATSLVSPRAPVLSTEQLDNIDLGKYCSSQFDKVQRNVFLMFPFSCLKSYGGDY